MYSIRIARIQGMHGQVHSMIVFYKIGAPVPQYRQIAVLEWFNQFQVRIFGGAVVQLDPKFVAETADAEIYFHTTLKSALDDLQNESQQITASGEWRPYDPTLPIK